MVRRIPRSGSGGDEEVVLTDASGERIGRADKIAAHRHGGRLHLAFSVLVFNSRGELPLQRRVLDKYHFGGRWSNTCCGLPRSGEALLDAVVRRLREELGFTCPLHPLFRFHYTVADRASGMTEREWLHVLMGRFDGASCPDRSEVASWRWVPREGLGAEIEGWSDHCTPWFRMILERMDLCSVTR